MKTCAILLAMAAACVAMPHPGPPAPPGPVPPMPHAMPPPPGAPATEMTKGGTDLKGEEALYLASPYAALPYQPYSAYSAYSIRNPGLGLGYGAIGGLGYSTYGLPSQPIYYY